MPDRPAPKSPVWWFRGAWTALALAAGPALAEALAGRDRSDRLVGAAASWIVWAVVLGASFVPRTVTLTVVRTLAPFSVLGALWAWTQDVDPPAAVLAVVASAIATTLAASAGLADAFVDGSAYGDERRVALRAPAAVVLGPMPIGWAVLVAGVSAGPVLAAGERWGLAAPATVAGGAAAVAVGERLHQLSRRWLVFVPAGLVVHDPLALSEPALLPRAIVDRIGPAPSGTDATDLTGRALGLALEIVTTEAVRIGRRGAGRSVEDVVTTSLLVTPGRPAAALELAASRRLPVRA